MDNEKMQVNFAPGQTSAELVIKSAKKTGRVITVEEHNIIGGLGEAVFSSASSASGSLVSINTPRRPSGMVTIGEFVRTRYRVSIKPDVPLYLASAKPEDDVSSITSTLSSSGTLIAAFSLPSSSQRDTPPPRFVLTLPVHNVGSDAFGSLADATLE